MRKLIFALLLLLPVTAGAQEYRDAPAGVVVGVNNNFSLAAAADQTVFSAIWGEPRRIQKVILSSDLVTAVDADSSVFRVEFLMAPPVFNTGFTGQWVPDITGGSTVYIRQTTGAGDTNWTQSTTGNIAADGANALSAIVHLEHAQGSLVYVYPWNFNPSTSGTTASQADAILALNECYGVRLYYDSEATVANNTGALKLALHVTFQQ